MVKSLSAGFDSSIDTVNLDLLLRQLGLRDVVLQWFQAYLSVTGPSPSELFSAAVLRLWFTWSVLWHKVQFWVHACLSSTRLTLLIWLQVAW